MRRVGWRRTSSRRASRSAAKSSLPTRSAWRAVNVETFGTGHVSDERIADLIQSHFDLRPGAIIRDLDLRRPIYRQTAAYGHFGRDDVSLPWEDTSRAAALRVAAGLADPVHA